MCSFGAATPEVKIPGKNIEEGTVGATKTGPLFTTCRELIISERRGTPRCEGTMTATGTAGKKS
jgi:hypothetical protein